MIPTGDPVVWESIQVQPEEDEGNSDEEMEEEGEDEQIEAENDEEEEGAQQDTENNSQVCIYFQSADLSFERCVQL